MRKGYLERAADTYRRALERLSEGPGQRGPVAGQALIGLGEMARIRGDLEDAARQFEEGIRLLSEWTRVGPLEGYMGLARVRWASGEYALAWQALETARRLAEEFDLTELDDLTVAMLRAVLWAMEENWEPVRAWAEGRGLYAYIDTPLREELGDPYEHRMHKYELLVLAQLLIAEGRPAAALRALDPLPELAERRGRPGLLIEVCALQALAWQACGQAARAFEALERALVAGEPEGYLQPLRDLGQPMRALLGAYRAQIAGRSGAAPLRAYVDRLLGLDAPPSAPPAQPAGLPEPLSERELEVLRLLSTSLSQPEIAERLYVSINTIRTHVKHVYAKLGVHGRTAAVERAEELGLL
jgi:LuxR family maltose regulon positive regulatory protein